MVAEMSNIQRNDTRYKITFLIHCGNHEVIILTGNTNRLYTAGMWPYAYKYTKCNTDTPDPNSPTVPTTFLSRYTQYTAFLL